MGPSLRGGVAGRPPAGCQEGPQTQWGGVGPRLPDSSPAPPQGLCLLTCLQCLLQALACPLQQPLAALPAVSVSPPLQRCQDRVSEAQVWPCHLFPKTPGDEGGAPWPGPQGLLGSCGLSPLISGVIPLCVCWCQPLGLATLPPLQTPAQAPILHLPALHLPCTCSACCLLLSPGDWAQLTPGLRPPAPTGLDGPLGFPSPRSSVLAGGMASCCQSACLPLGLSLGKDSEDAGACEGSQGCRGAGIGATWSARQPREQSWGLQSGSLGQVLPCQNWPTALAARTHHGRSGEGQGRLALSPSLPPPPPHASHPLWGVCRGHGEMSGDRAQRRVSAHEKLLAEVGGMSK